MRLVSLNIERSKHFGKVIPFLKTVNPDVVCIQELHERDIPLFREAVGKNAEYAANCLHIPDEGSHDPHIMGVGIFTRHAILAQDSHYYCGTKEGARSLPVKTYIEDHSLVTCDVEHGGSIFRVMTTHFTWTHKGEPNDLQRKNMRSLLRKLGQSGDFILTGDFNAPRGGEIFSELSSRFKDNVPAHHETSIDVNLHIAGKTQAHELKYRMVDGLFTTPRYTAANVELVFGISDHAAIVADISSV